MRHSAGTWSGKTSEVPRDPFWTQILGRSFRDAQSTYALATPAHKKRGKARVLPSLRAICSRFPTSGAD